MHFGAADLLQIVMVERARQRIDLVYIHFFGVRMDKKVDASDATQVERTVDAHPNVFYRTRELGADFRGHFAIAAVDAPFASFLAATREIFILESKKFGFVERALALGCAQSIVAHNRQRNLDKRFDAFFHEHLIIVVKSDFYRLLKLAFIFHFGDAEGRTEMHGLYEERPAELRDFRSIQRRLLSPCCARKPYVGHDLHTFCRNNLFGEDLIHCDSRTKYIASDKRYARHAKHSLQRAVLTVCAVHRRKDYIDVHLFSEDAGPHYIESVFKRELYLLRARKLLHVRLVPKEGEVVHRLVCVPLSLFGNVDGPHVKGPCSEEGFDDGNVCGHDGHIVLRAFASEYNCYCFHDLNCTHFLTPERVSCCRWVSRRLTSREGALRQQAQTATQGLLGRAEPSRILIRPVILQYHNIALYSHER